jgi:hypothetical protein
MNKKMKYILKAFVLCFIVLFFSQTILYYLNRQNFYRFSVKQKNDSINQKYNLNLIKNKSRSRNHKLEQILQDECNIDIKKPTIKCLNALKSLGKLNKNDRKDQKCNECMSQTDSFIIYHHTFWQLNYSSFNRNDIRIFKLSIMSYLFTQNLCCTRFILWKLNDFPIAIENNIKKTFHYYIESNIINIKTFDMNQVCKLNESTFRNYEFCNRKFNNSDYTHSYAALSDFVRFVVLDIYPGIYTDGDVIYLKDMSLLWNYNFAYKWSFTDGYNTAVMGINKNIDNSIISIYNQILPHCNSITNCIAFFHPSSISQILAQLNKKSVLIKMNSLLFDPSWLCHDGIIDRFNPSQVCKFSEFNENVLINVTNFEPSLFYDGPFTYHMHLAGGRIIYIVSNSYFDYFEKFYHKNLEKLNLN